MVVWNDFLRLAPTTIALPSFPIWSMEFGATYPFEGRTPSEIWLEEGPRGMDDYLGIFGAPLRGLSEAAQRALLPSHALRSQGPFPKWKQNFLRSNRTFYESNRDWIDTWLPSVQGFPSSWQKFEWNAQGEERNLWHLITQFRASGVRVKRPTTAPSLVAMTATQVPIVSWESRYMTPRECSRLQSLGDIKLPETPNVAYKALGNAVNARVVSAVAQTLLAADRQLVLSGQAA